MKLKSLGYTNQEIAYRIGCSEPAVSYHLKQIRAKAEKGEGDDLFWGLVAVAAGIGIVELLKRLNK
jgi:predicted transcriptional regulator